MAFGDQGSFTDSVVRVRAIAVIAAAPLVFTGWTSCQDKEWLTFYMEYERGAVGGAVTFSVQYRLSRYLGAYVQSALAVGAVAVNADTTSNIQRELLVYGATAAGAEGFIYGPIRLGGCIEDFRVGFYESGVAGTPGDFGIDAQMGDRA